MVEGKAEKSEMSEVLDQTLKLLQLRLFVSALCAINKKSEISDDGFFSSVLINFPCCKEAFDAP